MRTKRADGWTYQRIADTAGVSFGTAHRVASDVLISDIGIENERGQQRPATYQRQDNDGPYLVAESEADVLDAARQIVKQRSAERQAQRNNIPLPPLIGSMWPMPKSSWPYGRACGQICVNGSTWGPCLQSWPGMWQDTQHTTSR